MRQFGLIGNPLDHSFSPAYFAEKFERENIKAKYSAFPISDISQLDRLLSDNDISGLNVTIPYKESVIPYLDELSETAKQIGAVNCILFRNDKRIGHNTDAEGFKNSLLGFLGKHTIQSALILGSGGSSKAIRFVMNELNINHKTVSSSGSGDVSYDELTPSEIRNFELIVNCTPLGTFPRVDASPDIPFEAMTNSHYLFDLVYNPEETLFLKRGRLTGAKTKNGLEMLKNQAELSWELWNS